MKVSVIFYSAHGHMYKMAQAAMEGINEVEGVDAGLYRFPETVGEEILEAMGAMEFQKQIASIPEATLDTLREADGLMFGIPTRFGNMIGQARAFFDSTGPLWAKGELVGKPAAVMSSSATQHGGQETTILTTQVTLLHHGMLIVGLPYAFQGQMTMDEITGGSPYGASTIAGGDGSRMPSDNELAGARFQARHLAEITKKLRS
ncbi:MAG: NAD(P)H:quinone oxidoreductase [Alkalispirochaetaceae bacterium]